MARRTWHNPDVSLTVMQRRIGADMLSLLLAYGGTLALLGHWRLMCKPLFPTRAAFYTAVYRLKKAGLIVTGERKGERQLLLTEPAKTKLRLLQRPDRFWQRDWGRYWYLLVYDVPETERAYRNTLRQFLTSQRLGCLQRSVYVTPWDIRPAFADLCEAADVGRFAFLFEAETVLGMDAMEIVHNAWPWQRLRRGHQWYYEAYQAKLEEIRLTDMSKDLLRTLAREEMRAYLSVMQDDPLLPRKLLPVDYMGGAVFTTHQTLIKTIKRVL